jgi:hypothetical protein
MLLYSVCGRNFNHIRMKLCCILKSASISSLDTNSCCVSVKGMQLYRILELRHVPIYLLMNLLFCTRNTPNRKTIPKILSREYCIKLVYIIAESPGCEIVVMICNKKRIGLYIHFYIYTHTWSVQKVSELFCL